MTEDEIIPGVDGEARRWPEAVAAIHLLATALIIAAALLPLAQLLSIWAVQREATFSTGPSTGGILRTWIGRVGLGPSILLLGSLLIVGLTGSRPLSTAGRRLLVGIVGIGLALAVAQALGALDALVASSPGGDGALPSDGSMGYRLSAALGMVAAGAVAGVGAWVAFTLLEQDRIARTDTAPADDPADGLDDDRDELATGPDDEDDPNF